MNRSIGVTIRAVIAFAGSALTLTYGAVFLRQLEVAALSHTQLFFKKDSMVFSVILSFIASAWGFTTAFGLLNFREWARTSTLVFSWLCIFLCLPLMLLYPVAPMERIEGTPEHFNLWVRLYATSFYAVFVIVGAWSLYFLNKDSTKEHFIGRSENVGTHSAPVIAGTLNRPLSVSIVSWYLLITAFMFITMYQPPVDGISRWELQLIEVAYALVHATAVVGLLEQKPWGRRLAICYFYFLILGTLAVAFSQARQPSLGWLMFTAPVSLELRWLPVQYSVVVLLLLAIPLFVIPLGVLIKEKQAILESV